MNPPVATPSGALVERGPSAGRRLSDLRPGQGGTVAAVAGTSELRRRLLELGFVSGTPLRVVRLAPLGDPMEVRLHGYHLSVRRADAAAVLLAGE